MIELFTAATPNGHKISIALEEMGLPYTVRALDLGNKEQKEDWFLAINPNGRIPAIIDHENDDFAVFESGAILVYLAEKSGKFLPVESIARSRVMQWLMFQMGGIGPMMGQANVFYRYAPEKIPYAIDRYQNECLRLFHVLEKQLAGREFICGELSIADFATFPWVRGYAWSGLRLKKEEFPHLRAYLDRMEERPAVQRGLAVPVKRDVSDRTQADEIVKAARNMLP